MKKIVIFNVGGALSCYGEFSNKKVIIDLGCNSNFSPVNDFLIPLSERKSFIIGDNHTMFVGKKMIDQVFLSHLDRDHISDYKNFREHFFAHYLTCPNDNNQQLDKFKVNRNSLGVESEYRNLVLDDMSIRTTSIPFNILMSPENPLVSIIDEISLFYITPQECEKEDILRIGYANNISLVLFLKVGDKTVLIPGDLLKDGMIHLIDNNPQFKGLLNNDGVDYLIAPHHGLQTSFSEYLFQNMRGNKTRLNIISEKIRVADSTENRTNVDSRYYSSEYSTADNTLNAYGVKTSLGHIVINFETPDPEIRKIVNIEDVINEFL